eukprot:GHVP01020312.1.p2 GENE.GHVP01020312.1~~GHVP01020312.1.p2  ORF type:complete len:539 (-),score=129.00 GHVP01020312.1:62-1678(-)
MVERKRRKTSSRDNRADRSEKSNRDREERLEKRNGSPSSASRRRWRFDSPPKGGNSKSNRFSDSSPVAEEVVPDQGNSPPKSPQMQQMNLTSEQEKAARELYIGNLPPNIDVNQLVEFLNAAMQTLNVSSIPGPPVTKSWKASDGHFAFAEFRSMEEANAGMQLNGLDFLGYSLKIGRPKTFPQELHQILASHYQQSSSLAQGSPTAASAKNIGPDSIVEDSLAQFFSQGEVLIEGVPSTGSGWSAPSGAGFSDGPAVPQRLVALELPKMDDSSIRELLSAFGVLHYFSVVRNDSEPPIPMAFFEYDSLKSQHAAITKLDRLNLNGQEIKICKLEDALYRYQFREILQKAIVYALNDVGGSLVRNQIPTKVLMLSNMFSKSKANLDEKELDEICLDIREECSECGQILTIEIPKPYPGSAPREKWMGEVGNAFVEFETVEGAAKARALLSGRKFEGRLVEGHYFSERKFLARDFEYPMANFSKWDSSLFAADLVQEDTEQETKEQEKEEERLREQGLQPTEQNDGLADELDNFAVIAR